MAKKKLFLYINVFEAKSCVYLSLCQKSFEEFLSKSKLIKTYFILLFHSEY